MIIAITGHRDIKKEDIDICYKKLYEVLSYKNVDEILFGGARGIDTCALECAYKIREELSIQVKLTVIVPFKLKDQPVNARRCAEKYADRIIELELPYSKGAYLRRNDELIRHADMILAFYRGKDGGTEYTIKKAIESGKKVKVYSIPEAK